MKARKILAIILLILGIGVTAYGGFFYGKELLFTNKIEKYNGNGSYENKVVAISGDLVTDEKAYDIELQTECDSAILLRDIKMLQWVNDDKGARLALANYEVGSFKVGEATFENPEFYKDLTRTVSHGILKAGDIVLDNSVLDLLANTSFVKKTPVTNINESGGFKYKLSPYNGAYVSASDEWSIGEVKVELFEVKDEDLNDVTIVGTVKDNTLTDAKVLDGKLTSSEVKKEILSDYALYLLLACAGLVLVLISIILLVINSKKKKQIQPTQN